MSAESREHVLELPLDPPACLRLLARTADLWGGSWQADGLCGGRLALPVMAGVRYGWVAGEVEVEEVAAAGEAGSAQTRAGSRLRFRVDHSDYHIDKLSFAVLLLAGGGALVTVFAPFFPSLFRLVPLSVLLAVGAWLFIVGRLRNSGPEEFFDDLAEESETAEPG